MWSIHGPRPGGVGGGATLPRIGSIPTRPERSVAGGPCFAISSLTKMLRPPESRGRRGVRSRSVIVWRGAAGGGCGKRCVMPPCSRGMDAVATPGS